MNNLINLIKKNKKKSTIIGVGLVVLIIFIVILYCTISYLIPNSKKSVYGDRCDITAEHPVDSKRKSSIKKFLEDYKNYNLKEFEVKCNLIDIVIEVDDSTNFSNVKKMGKSLLSVFSKDEVKYYDIQLLIKSKKDNSEYYPQIGTHHKQINGSSNDDFVW